MTSEPKQAQQTAGDFGWALNRLWDGAHMQRRGWNGKGMWIALQRPGVATKMTLPYMYMSTVEGDLVPWVASQTDQLAMDWQEAEWPPADTAA